LLPLLSSSSYLAPLAVQTLLSEPSSIDVALAGRAGVRLPHLDGLAVLTS
jgi:hypothetical protein